MWNGVSSGRAVLLCIQFLVGKYLSIPFTKKTIEQEKGRNSCMSH